MRVPFVPWDMDGEIESFPNRIQETDDEGPSHSSEIVPECHRVPKNNSVSHEALKRMPWRPCAFDEANRPRALLLRRLRA